MDDSHLWLALAFAALCYIIGRSHVLTGREISLALKRRRFVAVTQPDNSIEVRWETNGDEPVMVQLCRASSVRRRPQNVNQRQRAIDSVNRCVMHAVGVAQEVL